jgi:hypothetical protein
MRVQVSTSGCWKRRRRWGVHEEPDVRRMPHSVPCIR